MERMFCMFVLFFVSSFGVLGNHRHVRRRMIGFERRLFSISISRLVVSVLRDDLFGVVGSLRVTTVAAAETSVGLGRLVVYYRVHGSVVRSDINIVQR